MADISFTPRQIEGYTVFDMALANGQYQNTDPLYTSVMISLFTDARLTQEEADTYGMGRGGWWGDGYSPVAETPIGSKLRLLLKMKQTQQTLEQAKRWAEDALRWLVVEGVVASISVEPSYPDRGFIALAVTGQKPSGQGFRYEVIWDKVQTP